MPITPQEALQRTIEHREIFHDEMLHLMRLIMKGELSPLMTAAIITGLRVKKETIGEITAAAQVMREFSTKVHVKDATHMVDIVGTGGDGANTFNISTTTIFVAAAAGANRDARTVEHRRRTRPDRTVDRIGDALGVSRIELVEVEGQLVAESKAGIDRALDRRAARDPAARRHIDRQLRPVGGIDAEPADDEIALHHRVNLSIGAIERREHERAAAQAFRLADRRDGHIKALAGFGKRRQFGGDHHRRGILQRRIDPRR